MDKLSIYNQIVCRGIFRFFKVFQTSGLRGLFDTSGHGVLPARAGFRKDARTPQRGVLRSAPILARPATFGGETPCPLESTRLFSKPARAGKTSERQNGAKFSRWENFASSRPAGLGRAIYLPCKISTAHLSGVRILFAARLTSSFVTLSMFLSKFL